MIDYRSIAIIGASETTDIGVVPNLSTLGLHVDAALNAIADAGIKTQDIDGIACAVEQPRNIASMLGVTPRWVDGTNVGGCSAMLHIRHAIAAIDAGYCNTVLITHGESGRSGIATSRHPPAPDSLSGQWEIPYGAGLPFTLATLPALRFLKETGADIEDLARVAVIQREWAQRNPRAFAREPITLNDVMNSGMIAYPFRKLMCCLITDGGGALILTRSERAADLPGKPVYILGAGEAVECATVSMMQGFTSSQAFRASARDAFESAQISHSDIDHLMIYDAFAHLPLCGLEDLGFCKRGEAKDFYRERRTAPGGELPLNTNGGGLSYTHTGMYGMYAIQESIRQLRGVAAAQVGDVKISLCHGMGNMFSAAGTVILTNEG